MLTRIKNTVIRTPDLDGALVGWSAFAGKTPRYGIALPTILKEDIKFGKWYRDNLEPAHGFTSGYCVFEKPLDALSINVKSTYSMYRVALRGNHYWPPFDNSSDSYAERLLLWGIVDQQYLLAVYIKVGLELLELVPALFLDVFPSRFWPEVIDKYISGTTYREVDVRAELRSLTTRISSKAEYDSRTSVVRQYLNIFDKLVDMEDSLSIGNWFHLIKFANTSTKVLLQSETNQQQKELLDQYLYCVNRSLEDNYRKVAAKYTPEKFMYTRDTLFGRTIPL